MSFRIVRNDIVRMQTDAIVNTANAYPTVGPGCDYAVYAAAGYDELLAYRRQHIGFVEEGEAFITPGFNLPAKYIIHAVSPYYEDGTSGEEDKLRSCYRKSLQLAKENGVRSIAFPLISTGGFGYPKEEGMRIAIDEIYDFLFDNEMDVWLVVFDSRAAALGEKLYPDLKAYIDQNYVYEKGEEEYETAFLEHRPPRPPMLHSASVRLDAQMMRSVRAPMNAHRIATPDITEECIRESASDVCEEPSCESAGDTTASIFDDEERYEELKRRLEERKAHLADSFSEYLLYLIASKGMTNADVYKRAIVDKKLFAKIKNDATYHPQKITCLRLCVGAKLSMDETKDLLARAGYALSPCDMRDVIFSYFIDNKIYDMIDLDILLEEHGIPCVIS